MERRQSLEVSELRASDYASALIIFVIGLYLLGVVIGMVFILLSYLFGEVAYGGWVFGVIGAFAYFYGCYRVFRFAVGWRILALLKKENGGIVGDGEEVV